MAFLGAFLLRSIWEFFSSGAHNRPFLVNLFQISILFSSLGFLLSVHLMFQMMAQFKTELDENGKSKRVSIQKNLTDYFRKSNS